MIRTAVLSLAVAALFSPAVSYAQSADATRRDDAYHFAQFAGGPHDPSYVEWWYFNLLDPADGVQLALTYAVLDPANRSGFGVASVAAIAYTQEGRFTETAVYPPTSFSASNEQADVLIAGGSPPTLNYIQVLSDNVYRIAGSIKQEHEVSWNLTYVRLAPAWLGADRQHVGVFAWEEMSWLQYMPGAAVTGEFIIDGRVFHVANRRGYHDHNWGEWVPFTVTWNWAQYFQPGLDVSIGDFRGSGAGVVSVESRGHRTVFTKDQYLLIHESWSYDTVNQLWFPTSSWLYAQNDERTMILRMGAHETVPVRPPPQIPLPLVPVIYEQTADFAGWLWEKDPAGAWQLTRAFRGDGFKEYTGISAVHP
jgi:hypothetical protein